MSPGITNLSSFPQIIAILCFRIGRAVFNFKKLLSFNVITINGWQADMFTIIQRWLSIITLIPVIRQTTKENIIWSCIMKTHVRGLFDTDLHEVSWHFATHSANGLVGSKFNWPSEDQCQRSHSKWVFVFIPHLKSKYNQLIVSKLSRKSAICPRRSPWRLIVLVRSLRSARLDTAWLVKSVTYFNLIG